MFLFICVSDYRVAFHLKVFLDVKYDHVVIVAVRFINFLKFPFTFLATVKSPSFQSTDSLYPHYSGILNCINVFFFIFMSNSSCISAQMD